jgi:predicted ester cyclase
MGKVRREAAEENRRKALRLYEDGLGRGDPSAVDEVASVDFRDLGGGHRGKPAMGRIVSDLRASYPDLSGSVEGQETEGDLVRTRLTIPGTDRGSGVTRYPPTGRRVSFEAEFVDRFGGGCW